MLFASAVYMKQACVVMELSKSGTDYIFPARIYGERSSGNLVLESHGLPSLYSNKCYEEPQMPLP